MYAPLFPKTTSREAEDERNLFPIATESAPSDPICLALSMDSGLDLFYNHSNATIAGKEEFHDSQDQKNSLCYGLQQKLVVCLSLRR
jgi:hypothetical protein